MNCCYLRCFLVASINFALSGWIWNVCTSILVQRFQNWVSLQNASFNTSKYAWLFSSVFYIPCFFRYLFCLLSLFLLYFLYFNSSIPCVYYPFSYFLYSFVSLAFIFSIDPLFLFKKTFHWEFPHVIMSQNHQTVFCSLIISLWKERGRTCTCTL
jgi:hypothetical protein